MTLQNDSGSMIQVCMWAASESQSSNHETPSHLLRVFWHCAQAKCLQKTLVLRLYASPLKLHGMGQVLRA